MKTFLTIITPTYNRGELLNNCYKSLKEQTYKNFEWIIVDDGSEDNTNKIVEKIIKENVVDVKYIYKENGGKHTALNKGIKKAIGELTLILDSDDILVNNCVEIIFKEWEIHKSNTELCGMTFLRSYSDGSVIGDKFPEDYLIDTFIDCRMNKGILGDKCEVLVTNILKQYEFPVFENEKFLGEHTVWVRIGRDYKTLHINKRIYITEYLEDGLTKAGRKLRIESPLGGIVSSNECVTNEFKFKIKLKNSILYNTYGYFSTQKFYKMYRNSKNKILFILTRPLGNILHMYWKKKYL